MSKGPPRIKEIIYDEQTRCLIVQFQSWLYALDDVPFTVYEDLIAPLSPHDRDKYFHKFIRKAFTKIKAPIPYLGPDDDA
jgi:KTSC domain